MWQREIPRNNTDHSQLFFPVSLVDIVPLTGPVLSLLPQGSPVPWSQVLSPQEQSWPWLTLRFLASTSVGPRLLPCKAAHTLHCLSRKKEKKKLGYFFQMHLAWNVFSVHCSSKFQVKKRRGAPAAEQHCLCITQPCRGKTGMPIARSRIDRGNSAFFSHYKKKKSTSELITWTFFPIHREKLVLVSEKWASSHHVCTCTLFLLARGIPFFWKGRKILEGGSCVLPCV